jgi:hypothetical protein
VEVLEPAQVEVASFEHCLPQKEINLKLSEPCISGLWLRIPLGLGYSFKKVNNRIFKYVSRGSHFVSILNKEE